MKTKLALKQIAICYILSAICQLASAQITAFTYQGRLNNGTNPASGNYDLTFSLFSTASGAGQVGSTVTNSTGVSNGLFAATLDFGANFPGADRWLEIAARTNGGGVFTTLSPRQKLTPTPYAVTAANLSGTLPSSQLPANVALLNANETFTGQVNFNVGNVGIGTLNPLAKLHVMGDELLGGVGQQGSLSLYSSSSSGSGAYGSFYADNTNLGRINFQGGGGSASTENTLAVNANLINQSDNTHALGTVSNRWNSLWIGSGTSIFQGNVGIGTTTPYGNLAIAGTSPSVNVGGSSTNGWLLQQVDADKRFRIFEQNTGGANEVLTIKHGGKVGIGTTSPVQTLDVAGAVAINGATVIDAAGNLKAGSMTATNYMGNGANLSNVNAATLNGLTSSGFWKTSGNYGANPLNGAFLGTSDNMPLELKVNGQRGLRLEPVAIDVYHFGIVNTIGGSSMNSILPGAVGSVICGGGAEVFLGYAYSNSVASDMSFLGGGIGNSVQYLAAYSFLGGGYNNSIQSNSSFSFLGGGDANSIGTNSDVSFLGGGYHNSIGPNASESFLGGGYGNSIASNAFHAFIGGGAANSIQVGAYESVLGGGYNNSILGSSSDSFIGGGVFNTIQAGAFDSFLGGGYSNTNGGAHSVVPGGSQNLAAGEYSFAAGQRSKAIFQGDFVWADSQNADFSATGPDQFLIRANGGVGININDPTDASLSVNGVLRMNESDIYLRSGTDYNHGIGFYQSYDNMTVGGPLVYGYTGGALGTQRFGAEHVALRWTSTSVSVFGTFNNNSDRNAKERIKDVNPSSILEKVTQLPVSEWSYKVDADTRHIGPMAQDFHAAFNIGTDDKNIAPIDEGGVALAAIQGLNQKVDSANEKLREELSRRDAENADLKRELSELKNQVNLLGRALNSSQK